MIGLVLAAVLGWQEPAPVENIAEIRGVLETTLNDYPSARFRLVRISEDGRFVCGEANWRGPAGGYGGWTTFTIEPGEGGNGYFARFAPNLEAMTNYRRWCDARTDWRPSDYSGVVTFED